MSSPSSPENTNNDNNTENKPSTQSEKKTKTSPKKGVSVVDRLTSSPSPTANTRNDTADENNNNNNKTRISPPATARSTSPFAPALAQKEYISELRARQDSQLTSIASYLESHVREPFGALCGKNLGGWTYGPSYSRTVESLEPEAESYPPTRSARRTVLLSSARSLPFNVQQEVRQREQHTHFSHGQHQRSPSRSSNNGSPVSTSRSHANYSVASSSRPGKARSTTATTVNSSRPSTANGLLPTSFYNVVLEAPFNVHPTSARFTHADNNNPSLMNVRSSTNSKNTTLPTPTSSGRPLAAEYYYPSKKRALRNDELVSKSDRAVQKHRDKQRKLEIQKEKLKNAAPMEFRWQV